jgi:3-oxoadipate enol-lactonase
MAGATPVVFLHAFPLDATMWAPQLEALAGERTTLAPDLPGFGRREAVDGGIDAMAAAVLADCDGAGIDRAAFVGLSMGGYVALRIQALAPERVAALVLADTRATADDAAGRQKRTDHAARARAEGTGWLAEAMLPALLGETTRRERPDVVDRVRVIIGRAVPEGVARALEAMRERPDSTKGLASIEAPVLALSGEEDALTPPTDAERIAASVPKGRLATLPGAGHLSNLENAPAFNEALLAFLRTVG